LIYYNMNEARKFIDDYLIKHNINKIEFLSGVRKRDLVFHRVILANVLRNVFNFELRICGELLNRDHSSLIHYEKEYDKLHKIYKEYFSAYTFASSFAKTYLKDKDKHVGLVHRLLVSNNVLRENINAKKIEMDKVKFENIKLKKQIEELIQTNKELRYNYV